MSIQIKFFASLREDVGFGDAELEATEVRSVADVWQKLVGDKSMPENTLVAINMDYVDVDSEVSDGDEVAFFPPVTGG